MRLVPLVAYSIVSMPTARSLVASDEAFFSAAVAVSIAAVRARPGAIPLAKKTMRKSTHGFPLFAIWVWGSAWQPPELRCSWFACDVIIF